MRKVWILVANGSLCKIFQSDGMKSLIEINHLEHAASRLPNHDLVSDRPGVSTDQFSSSPHMMDEMSPKMHEKDLFAKEVAEILEDALQHGSYERLYVIASLPFASYLNHHITESVKKTIHAEIHKDLTLIKPSEIRDHLPYVL